MRFPVTGAAVVLTALAVFVPTAAGAQQWTADLRMGRLDFRLDPGVTTTSMAAGLSRLSTDGRFALNAGIPTSAEDPLWGAADAFRRLSTDAGPLELGLDLSGQGFVQRYARSIDEEPGPGLFDRVVVQGPSYGWGAATQVTPFVAAAGDLVRLELRGGASGYRTGLDGRTGGRDVLLGAATLSVTPHANVSLALEASHYASEQQDWTYAGARGLVTVEAFDLWGSLGRWVSADAATPWSAGAALRLTRRLDLTLEARQDALDPLYGSAPRRSWSAGLKFALSAPPTTSAPVPSTYDNGVATLTLGPEAAPSGARLYVGGSFNDWEPQPMTWDGERWSWRAPLEPGVYEYAFRTEDGSWFVPESTPGRKDDGMGGHVALLVVEEEGA